MVEIPVTTGGAVEKIVLGRSKGQVRGDVDMQAMDANATCNFCAVQDKEIDEKSGERVPEGWEATTAARDLIMDRVGGHGVDSEGRLSRAPIHNPRSGRARSLISHWRCLKSQSFFSFRRGRCRSY